MGTLLRRVTRFAVTLAWGVACSDPGGESVSSEIPRDPVVIDSAGVTIVELPASALEDLPVLRLADEPTVSIGGLDPEPESAFELVTYAARFSTGEIVVGDQNRRTVSLFGPDGEYLRTLARPGDGPGEIRQTGSMTIAADTLFLAEGGPRRLSLYTVEGFANITLSHPSATTFRDSVSRLAPSGLGFSDRATSFYHLRPPTVQGGINAEARTDGPVTEPHVLFRRDDDSIVRIGELPGIEYIVGTSVEGGRGSTRWLYKPFGQVSFVALGRDGLVTALSHRIGFERRDREGRPVLVVRSAVTPDPVDADDVSAVRDSLEPRMRELGGTGPVILEHLTFGEAHPLVAELAAGTDGTVWLRDPERTSLSSDDAFPEGLEPPDPTMPRALNRWLVFSADGRPLARVLVPWHLWVQEYDLERGILALPQDEFDVQRIQVRHLVPVEGGGA